MPGELWREVLQYGRETVIGTAVAATRKGYFRDVSLTRERAPRVHRFATGTRDNARAVTLGPIQAGGSLSLPVSADELVELMLIGVQGAVTPTTPAGFTAGRQWRFKPSETVDAMTVERNDGARLKRARGVHVNSYTFAGNVREENLLTCELFARDYADLGALTGALSDRDPTFMEGWETRLYVEGISGTPLTTQQSFALINWDVTLNNNLGRKYFADNTLATGGITFGELDVTATLLIEAAAAMSATEFTNWDNETGRLVVLEFGQNEVIDVGTNEVQTLTEGTPLTAGTFTLTYRGQTTSALGFNATAAATQAALEALGAIGVGNVTVTGGPLDTVALTVTFVGQLAGTNVNQLTSTQTGLTGTFTHATSTPGAGSKRAVRLYLPGLWSAFNLNAEDEGTRTYELTLQGIYSSTQAYGFQIDLINNRTVAFA